MYYIFNKNNKCIASCDFEPNSEDLETRDEFFREFKDKVVPVGSTINEEDIITLPQEYPVDYTIPARRLRNNIRAKIDIYVLPTSTYKDVLVSEGQKQDLIQDSLKLASWPKTENWPYCPLPALSTTSKEIIGDFSWDYPETETVEISVEV